MANFAATTVLLLVYFHCSLAITCHECVHMDTGERIACEDPSSAEVQTICGGAVSGCVHEKVDNVNPGGMMNTFRYCTAGGSPGRFAATNQTSCMHFDYVEVLRDVCTCVEDLCNYDGCSTCEEYCNVQADDPVPDTSMDIDTKEGGITCMECFDPNSLETRCGLPGVQEVETYCGDDASSACVEINVIQYDSNSGTFRRCFETAVKDFPEYFMGLTDVSTYSSNISFRGCNVLELNGGGSVTTCICDEDRCNSPCTFCESCEEDETTTTTTSSSQPTTSTTAGSGVANASPLAVSAIFLALQLY